MLLVGFYQNTRAIFKKKSERRMHGGLDLDKIEGLSANVPARGKVGRRVVF